MNDEVFIKVFRNYLAISFELSAALLFEQNLGH